MTKSSKITKIKEKKPAYIYYLFFVILTTSLVYFFSLSRPWQPFDERLIYNEELLPVPASFSEIFEVINSFVFNYHILSMNSFFSNCVTLRSNQLASILMVFVSFFFKKSALLYHLLQLFIHLINSALIFLIFKKSAEVFNSKKSLSHSEYLTILILTLIWALHSANTEAVLLVTNWTTLLTYTFCFLFLLYEISNIQKNNFISIAVLFGLLMFFTEYAYSLPLIIFFTVFSFALKDSYPVSKAITLSFKKSLPYFAGLFIYILFSLTSSGLILNLINKTSLYAFFERNFWLTPQIFMHFLKLLFFPKTLSTYQSNLIHLSDTLFNPYSILCTSIYLIFLILPVVLFILFKKSNNRFLCPLIYCFYFSLFPFLHILTPTYCLIADRYCYFPLFTLIFFILNVLFCSKQKDSRLLIALLSCILLALTTRTLIRINEWNNPESFYNSAIKADKKPLYKGLKFLLLADFLNSQNTKLQTEDAIQKSLKEFNPALKELTFLREEHLNQPLTLKLYGLDYDSLLLKAAYGIGIIKKSYLKEPVSNIIKFFEPYIEKRLDYSAPNEIAFYGDLLLKNEEWEKAKSVYESGYRKFPFVLEISLPLADFYLTHENNPDKSFQILQESYKYYPNKGMPMYKLLKYYEEKNDPANEAKFSYLLGLREHSMESYQHAAQIYLDLNKSVRAKKALNKLLQLNPNNPLTLLQLSRYMDLTGDRTRILHTLNKAYLLNKASQINDPYTTKAILENLVNINYRFGNLETTKKYLSELESIKDLPAADLKQIKLVKENLEMK